MLPDRCSVKQSGRDCVNPPEYVVEIVHNNDSYMVGITCEKHKDVVTVKIGELQKIGKIPEGILEFQKLKSVGTDCVKGNPDDVLIQLD
ncbi:MAG: hypothetical protein QF429_02315 [Candidatus Nitrosopelagicus sp.]|jgi:hypothetical protein|nr:hypothetical protein [Candidatus Nitrosopelagicus sp.]